MNQNVQRISHYHKYLLRKANKTHTGMKWTENISITIEIHVHSRGTYKQWLKSNKSNITLTKESVAEVQWCEHS